MIVVFDGLIGFGVRFRVVLVKKNCDLVKFGESYGGLKGCGYGGFRERS